MRDVKKILMLIKNYMKEVGESPIEYFGYSETRNFTQFLMNKFNINDTNILNDLKLGDGYLDVFYHFIDFCEEAEYYNTTEINGIILDKIGYFDAPMILVVEYLISNDTTRKAYDDFIEEMEMSINEIQFSKC